MESGVGIRNAQNTVGIAVFVKEFEPETRIGIYSLLSLKTAITTLSSILPEDTELVLDVLKMESGPLLTIRSSEKTKMATVVCPIVPDED